MCNISSSQIDVYSTSLRQVTDFSAYFAHPERYNGITDYISQMRSCAGKFATHASSLGNCDAVWIDAIIAVSAFY